VGACNVAFRACVLKSRVEINAQNPQQPFHSVNVGAWFMEEYAPKHCRKLAQSTNRSLFKVWRITQSWDILGAYNRVPVPVFYCSPTLPPRKLAMLADGLGTLHRLERSYTSAA